MSGRQQRYLTGGAGEHELVYLEWCDAITTPHPWMSQEEAIEWADEEDWVVSEVGWILKETKEYIVIASRKNLDDDTCNFAGIMKIPTTWILCRLSLQEYVDKQAKKNRKN